MLPIDESTRGWSKSARTHSHGIKMASRFLSHLVCAIVLCVCVWPAVFQSPGSTPTPSAVAQSGGGKQTVRWGGQGGGGRSRRWRDNVDSSFCLMM